MKKTLLVLLITFGVFELHAQTNVFPSKGSVGIGTTSPLAPLHIKTGDNKYGAILGQANEYSFQLYCKTLTTQPTNVESFRLGLKHFNNESNGFISFYRGPSSSGGFLGFSTNGLERMRINQLGYVGIGTMTPKAPLEITANGSAGTAGFVLNNTFSAYSSEREQNRPMVVRRNTLDNESIALYVQDYATHFTYENDESASSILFRLINHDVEGTNNEKFATDRTVLSIHSNRNEGVVTVDGRLVANEIKVEAKTADFVFEKDYQNTPLDEIEKHIKKYGHLPNIPSAKQMKKDGMDLATMNQLLLQKIEELTLHLIEAKKNEKVILQKLDELNTRLTQLEQ